MKKNGPEWGEMERGQWLAGHHGIQEIGQHLCNENGGEGQTEGLLCR